MIPRDCQLDIMWNTGIWIQVWNMWWVWRRWFVVTMSTRVFGMCPYWWNIEMWKEVDNTHNTFVVSGQQNCWPFPKRTSAVCSTFVRRGAKLCAKWQEQDDIHQICPKETIHLFLNKISFILLKRSNDRFSSFSTIRDATIVVRWHHINKHWSLYSSCTCGFIMK